MLSDVFSSEIDDRRFNQYLTNARGPRFGVMVLGEYENTNYSIHDDSKSEYRRDSMNHSIITSAIYSGMGIESHKHCVLSHRRIGKLYDDVSAWKYYPNFFLEKKSSFEPDYWSKLDLLWRQHKFQNSHHYQGEIINVEKYYDIFSLYNIFRSDDSICVLDESEFHDLLKYEMINLINNPPQSLNTDELKFNYYSMNCNVLSLNTMGDDIQDRNYRMKNNLIAWIKKL